MINDLAQDAITHALKGNWKEATESNLQILETDPENSDALNRLARAYSELGNLKKARETAKKVLKKDPYNTIAKKALEKWKGLKKGEKNTSQPSSPQLFLEEPGRTKIISVLHLGSPSILAKLDAGDEVKLNCHSHRASITTTDGKYIGRLPDNLSARLRKFIQLGNEYQAFIKSVNKNDVKVFIRETKRTQKLSDVPTFSTERIDYISFTPPELVHKKDEIHNMNEEDFEE
jgi:tetratricopeptide (TPR) repeat protein